MVVGDGVPGMSWPPAGRAGPPKLMAQTRKSALTQPSPIRSMRWRWVGRCCATGPAGRVGDTESVAIELHDEAAAERAMRAIIDEASSAVAEEFSEPS